MVDVQNLAQAARELLAGCPDPCPSFTAAWPVKPPLRAVAPGGRLSVVRWLDGIARLATPLTRFFVEAIVAGANDLAWQQTYSAKDIGVEFLDRYGWTELLGERGPLCSDQVAVGLLLLGADTMYPSHAHQAEEVYLPLAGRAQWWQEGAPWQYQGPGQPVHHRAWIPHAMRTWSEPLLALYAWRGGDLSQKSRIL